MQVEQSMYTYFALPTTYYEYIYVVIILMKQRYIYDNSNSISIQIETALIIFPWQINHVDVYIVFNTVCIYGIFLYYLVVCLYYNTLIISRFVVFPNLKDDHCLVHTLFYPSKVSILKDYNLLRIHEFSTYLNLTYIPEHLQY